MMQTERIDLPYLLTADSSNELSAVVDSMKTRIRSGAVVIYPTETIYGIGAVASNAAARDRIYSIKGRAQNNPLILVAPRRDAFISFGIVFPALAHTFAQKFWPGNLTLVLAHRDGSSIGVREVAHPAIDFLWSITGEPFYSTSANLSGEPYNPDPDSIAQTFDGTVDFMLDAGVLPLSQPSSVVKVTADDTWILLREGVVTKEELKAVAGCEGE